MSNVLIGIIGVILFIGLALAGALFLGPRFQQSTIDSKAAAVVQGLKQVGDAANLYELSEGSKPDEVGTRNVRYTPQDRVLLARGYLKSIPTGSYTVFNEINNTTRTVAASLDSANDQVNQAVCEAIGRQTGTRAPIYSSSQDIQRKDVFACVRFNDGEDYDAFEVYYFY